MHEFPVQSEWQKWINFLVILEFTEIQPKALMLAVQQESPADTLRRHLEAHQACADGLGDSTAHSTSLCVKDWSTEQSGWKPHWSYRVRGSTSGWTVPRTSPGRQRNVTPVVGTHPWSAGPETLTPTATWCCRGMSTKAPLQHTEPWGTLRRPHLLLVPCSPRSF